MRNLFILKLMLISLLTAMSMVAKADYIEFKTKDGLCYGIDTDAKYATLSKYEGAATKVVIPKSVVYKGVAYDVTSLDDNCFADCSSLISVSIPSSVTSLGIGCFMWCSSLTSITIPSSVTSLGAGCFWDCSSLTSVTIPSSVTSLKDNCFADCSSLASITIPSSITSLDEGCFYGCSSLTSITIPSSVTSIGRGCFADCSSLASIRVEANNPAYDSRENCHAIIETSTNTMIAGCRNTIIPSSVTSLGNFCFQGCSSLTSITIPSCVTHLGTGCFEGCSSLTSINIPSSVTDMENQCFDACSSLKTVICEMPTPIEGIFFYKTPIDQAVLYVPKSSFSSYQSSKTWNEFRTILPIASNHPSKP